MRIMIVVISAFLISQTVQAYPLNKSFINLAKIVNPSVVNISAITRGSRGTVEIFPGLVVPYNSPNRAGVGSGFVISGDGLIVTNAHVVDKATEIKVQFEGSDNFYNAKVLGKDKLSDIALLKIKTKRVLKPARLGDSSKLQVGEWVAAIGNPHNYGHTMTKGIISAAKREIDDLNLFPLIQTDASINPGNSGGPLVNLKGEVVGVNNAIAAGATGISFAIPINNVKTVLKDLRTYGYVRRGFIGIQFKKLTNAPGIFVTGLVKDGPAHRAGLKAGDIIIEFNKKKIHRTQDLPNAISKASIGKRSRVVILRDKKKLTVHILVQLPKTKSMTLIR